MRTFLVQFLTCVALTFLLADLGPAQAPEPIVVEGQPLAQNVNRILQALDYLGAPLPAEKTKVLQAAIKSQDAMELQTLLDPHVLVQVNINPEARVKAKRGPAKAVLQQDGYMPVLVKVVNEGGVTQTLNVACPQALPIHARDGSRNITREDIKNRFLDLEIFTKPPLTEKLSGLQVEYAVVLIHSSQAGMREATLVFDIGQGTQDLGFRPEVPILFKVQPAVPVKLTITDFDGKPTTGRFTFKDKQGRVYPPMSNRRPPDLFFQEQIYRHSGQSVLLPPGELTMIYGRGPEYRMVEKKVTIAEEGTPEIKVNLERWINPAAYGWYSGDHHIHAAGCGHYETPTQGVLADTMFLQVKGEGLNAGCNLTWGPCFNFQRQFFEPKANKLSEPFTVLKYDIEVSGFGSEHMGHVCLLNLREQDYPGSKGTTTGWPTWTTPVMRWAKAQGAYCGYAHSANGLTFDAAGGRARELAKQTLAALDNNKDSQLSPDEAKKGLLPDDFDKIDANKDGFLTEKELVSHIDRITRNERENLPNLAVPSMNGVGAQEICVTAAQGLCDFISAMNTQRVPEWNCWYHIMNCGFPLKVSGETDFPCVTGSRVGQGRVYVQLGKINKIDFADWAEGLAKGRSYVSDGYAHVLQFTVDGKHIGEKLNLAKGGTVQVKAKVAFSADNARGEPRSNDPVVHLSGQVPQGKTRLVEIVVNGRVAASKEVPADNKEHDLAFDIKVERSSWIALRHFPQLHTNPVMVLVDGQPIRASRKSALWCIGTIEQLWRERGDPLKMPLSSIDKQFAPKNHTVIAAREIQEVHRTFQRIIEIYRKIAAECPEES
jgi:hypothetical protein